MIRRISLFTVLCFGILSASLFAQEKAISRKEYLAYAKTAAEDYWYNYNQDIERWKSRIDLNYVFGYAPPASPVYIAYVDANLYKLTKDKIYAERAKKFMVEYGNFRDFYPKDFWRDKPGYENGVPVISNIFTMSFYVKAYRILKDTKYFSADDKKIIEANIEEGCNHTIRTQEWGSMNRGVLRAEALYLAALALPHAENAKYWKMMAESIIKDCWGRWEIEDAQGYAGIYLYALVSLAEVYNNDDFWNEAVTRYTMQYYLRLLAPHGMIPDFGDANLYSNWHRFMTVFEKAATEYNDPELKYAADRIGHKFWDFKAKNKSTWLAIMAIDCYRWADDSITPKPPEGKSGIVLEDLVGKKVVFRDGYGDNDTYLLVNYKDEGTEGFMSRAYLRETISVEEEKMTHGHQDENDIPLLMVDGSLLLHDGGYRDFMPSGEFGAYRADYFHNRIAIRKDKMFKGQEKGGYRYATKNQAAVPGQNVLDFMHNSGAYREVRTELVDFLSLKDFDFSRTRMIDEKKHAVHDRTVTWIKPLNIFVVFDAVKFTESDYYTTVDFWHTQHVLKKGEYFFDTQYKNLRNIEFPTGTSLLMYFPQGTDGGRMIGSDPEKRYYGDETAIHQALSRWHNAGELATFITVLIPHKTGSDISALMKNVEIVKTDHYPQAQGIKITANGKTYYVCSKFDRRYGITDKDYRPTYTYDSGKVKYDEFETDGQQFMAVLDKDILNYTSVYAIKLSYKGKALFEQLPVPYGLQYDNAPDRPGIGKVRYWSDTVKIK